MSNNKEIPVLVTTEWRGVFFGYATPAAYDAIADGARTICIARARNVVFWAQADRGFLSLAANGPSDECRIGHAAPEIALHGVTAVARVSPDSVSRWERAPWRL